MYITLLKQFKLWEISAVIGNVAVVDALTSCALLHSVCGLKATKKNVKVMKFEKSLFMS